MAVAPQAPHTSILRHPRPDWSRFCRAITLGLLAFLAIRAFGSTFVYADSGDMDFGSYYRGAQYVAKGESPYQPNEYGPLGTYPYAPAYVFLLIPLTWLDYITAFRCWQVMNWLATFACFRLAIELVLPPERRRDMWPILLQTTITVIGYVWANVAVGQAGMLVLLGCLSWAVWQRRGRPFLGGLCLAAACAAKLAPFALVPYLLIQRDKRGLAGVAAGLTAIFLTPALWVGVPGAVRLHMAWAENTRATQIPLQTIRRGNQSLLAELARLPAISNGHFVRSVENLETLHHWYPVILGAIGLALYALLWRRSSQKPGFSEKPGFCDGQVNWQLALLLLYMMLGHPRAWRCNFVTLILPAMLLADTVCRRRAGWRVGLVALLSVPLACVIPTDGLGSNGGWSWLQWFLEGKHFWASVAVTVACLRAGRLGDVAEVKALPESDEPIILPFPRQAPAEEQRKAA